MQQAYKLYIAETHPLTLAFPKAQYAVDVAVVPAALLR